MNRNAHRTRFHSQSRSLANFRRATPELASGTCFVNNPRLFEHLDPIWLLCLTLPSSTVQALRDAKAKDVVELSTYEGKDSFAGDRPHDIFVTLSCPGHCVVANVPTECEDVRHGLRGFLIMGLVPILLAAETHDDLHTFTATWSQPKASFTRDELSRHSAVLRSHFRTSGTRGVLTICDPARRIAPNSVLSK